MGAILTLSLFIAALIGCILSGHSILWALAFGLLLFSFYAKLHGVALRNILLLIGEGIKKSSNILIIFACIGLLTGSWRIAGTIPFLVYHGVQLITPQLFVLFAFLLCVLMSLLTGSSFASVSTMGLVCILLARACGVDPLPVAGAIMSGIYFGDRCSPMSSSASLVCLLTETELYANIKRMAKSALIPTLLTLLLYTALSFTQSPPALDTALLTELEEGFSLSPLVALPALLIVILSLFRLDVKWTMLISVVSACLISLFHQGDTPAELLQTLLLGYRSSAESGLLHTMSGGGLRSMLNVACVVCLSSSYFGIFHATDLLDLLHRLAERIAERAGDFAATLASSTLLSVICCNQTLSVMLSAQICAPLYRDPPRLANHLEDTAILIAAIPPWSIACGLPLATMGVDFHCLPFAFFLYLPPLWGLIRTLREKKTAKPALAQNTK